ncbi:hypothetical protein C366_02510 [Cryptococcus neoformans Tu401-1]|nr:hypothetical protein C366_02510 [Cryptococcus neoformans var. grubii Tu401-1]
MPDTYRPSPGDSDSLLDELASYGSRTPSPQPGEDDPVALQDYIHKLTKGELEAPVHQVMDTKKLYDLIKSDYIDLSPDYQRDVVWTSTKMICLIQSVMLKYYVPPLIFSHNNLRLMNEKLVCIDGKQRCTSIVRFMDGEIPFVSPGTKEKLWFKDGPGKRKLLPLPLRRHFEQVNLPAVTYKELGEEQQRDIFQRVQLGVALSSAEKLQALSSPWAQWCSKLEKKYITASNTLGDLLSWDIKRAKSFQNVVGFVYLAKCKTEGREAISTGWMSLKGLLEANVPLDPHFMDEVDMAMSIWLLIAQRYYAAAFDTISRRVAPVESWFIPFLIFVHMHQLPYSQLAQSIGDMRQELHAVFVGNVFANTKVSRWLLDWINKVESVKKRGVETAEEQWKREKAAQSQTEGEGRKRRRRD